MKLNWSLKKTLISSLFLCACGLASAETATTDVFTCPSVEDLANFHEGFYLEFPISFSPGTQNPNAYMVAQIAVKQEAVDALIISPVQERSDEYLTETSEQMINNLQFIEGSLSKDEHIDGISNYYLCSYWNSTDGSLAYFLHKVAKNPDKPNAPGDIRSTFKAIQKLQAKSMLKLHKSL